MTLYLARIRYFEINPPGPGWDGAFRPSQIGDIAAPGRNAPAGPAVSAAHI